MKVSHLAISMVFLVSSLFSQIHISGSTHSLVYSWEDRNETGMLDIYQGFQADIRHEKWASTSLSTYFREAYFKEPGEWESRLYKLYLTTSPFTSKIKMRLGRQFLYKGVINGTVDGLCMDIKLLKSMSLGVVGGSLAPLDRDFKAGNWENGNLIGAYTALNLLKNHKAQISYVRKEKYEELAWHQVGLNLNGMLSSNLLYYGNLDYNMEASTIQKLRVRGNYQLTKWMLGLEYTLQRPMIYEYSYFNVFEIEAYNQIRTSIGYNMNSFYLQLNYVFTMMEDDNSNEMVISVSRKHNSIGLLYNKGFSGDNIGVFGQINQPIWKNLSLRLYGNYYNYERYMIDISEHATSFSAGLQYHKGNSVFRTELQQATNNVMKNDWRGYFQYLYSFNL